MGPVVALLLAGASVCPDATTTVEINECLATELGHAEEELERYLLAASARVEKPRGPAWDDGQAAWQDYRDAECDAVFAWWADGTIRTAKELGCRIALTHERTRIVWRHWLTYEDSTPPVLPEPD